MVIETINKTTWKSFLIIIQSSCLDLVCYSHLRASGPPPKRQEERNAQLNGVTFAWRTVTRNLDALGGWVDEICGVGVAVATEIESEHSIDGPNGFCRAREWLSHGLICQLTYGSMRGGWAAFH